jgi:hypothetical protein
MARLVEILERLAVAVARLEAALLDRRADRPHIEPMAVRIEEVARLLGVSRRIIERERAAGRFPAADMKFGRLSLWSVSRLRAFLERGHP